MRCAAASICPLHPVCQEQLAPGCPGAWGAQLVLRLWERRPVAESVVIQVGELREEAGACGAHCR
jgi:hypothetical protein